MKIYNTKIQADYDALMIELEEKGYKWLSGRKPTSKDYWSEENSCIKISGKNITFGSIERHKKDYPDIPIIEYKAKGDKQMLNTECKQCHKKWHHDNAKYCSMCGNKLIDEPEFKVGDYVVEDGEEYIHGKAISLIERYVGSIYLGSYYVTGSNRFVDLGQDDGSEIDVDCTRHATPEEIAEYESALNFHKHGRKPFEVRIGDLVQNASGHKHIITMAFNNKNLFLLNNTKLLATAEEINEWLGADDE